MRWFLLLIPFGVCGVLVVISADQQRRHVLNLIQFICATSSVIINKQKQRECADEWWEQPKQQYSVKTCERYKCFALHEPKHTHTPSRTKPLLSNVFGERRAVGNVKWTCKVKKINLVDSLLLHLKKSSLVFFSSETGYSDAIFSHSAHPVVAVPCVF